ncbi:hypothetical protein BC828DRAFT_380912 [Blastocladiella britannica]|nr:hypothetical protein BC828DRAFT_380912 [Blastocladiella britannica]
MPLAAMSFAARPHVGKLWQVVSQAAQAARTPVAAQVSHSATGSPAVALGTSRAPAPLHSASQPRLLDDQYLPFHPAPSWPPIRLRAAAAAVASADGSALARASLAVGSPTNATASSSSTVQSSTNTESGYPHDGPTLALVRALDRELESLSSTDPVARVVAHLREVLLMPPSSANVQSAMVLSPAGPVASAHRRNAVLMVLEAATRELDDPVAVARLHLVAQRVLARLGDLEALREWKKRMALAADQSDPATVARLGPPMPAQMVHTRSAAQDQHSQAAARTQNQIQGNNTSSGADPNRKPYLEYKSHELLRLSRERNLAGATAVFYSLVAKSLTPLGDATHAYLELLATAPGHADDADAAFRKLYQIEHDAAGSPVPMAPGTTGRLARHVYFLYCSYLSAVLAGSHADRAVAAYSDMVRDVRQLPDLRTLTKLFAVLAKQTPPPTPHHLDAMVRILDDLRNQGITPYPLLFNQALATAVALGRRPLAAALYDRMVAAGATPTAVTYSTLIKSELAAGDVRAAEAWFDAMCGHAHAQPRASRIARSQFGNSVGPFNALIQHYVQVTHDNAAADRVFATLERQFVPVVAPSGFTLHLLTAGCMVPMSNGGALAADACADAAMTRIRQVTRAYPSVRANASHFLPVLEALVAARAWPTARSVVQCMRGEFRVDPRGEAIEALVAKVAAAESSL